MNRRLWTGVVAGTLAALVLLMVGFGAYRAGQRDELVTRTVSDGEVVRVVGDHHWGPGPGFFLFPLLIILLVVLLFRRRRWGYGGGHRGGPGRGPWGPGYLRQELDEWHRQAHGEAPTTTRPPTTTTTQPEDAPSPPPDAPPRDDPAG